MHYPSNKDILASLHVKQLFVATPLHEEHEASQVLHNN
jgi:hypothetical protein